MKAHKAFLLIFFLSLYGFSQNTLVLNAYTMDNVTRNPISYVQVGFLDEGIGTISNKQGFFKLEFDEEKLGANPKMRMSRIGYKSIELTMDQLFTQFEKSNRIYLEPDTTISKNSITDISNPKTSVFGFIGDESSVKSWEDMNTLGAEIGTLIKINKKQTKLNSLEFDVLENTSSGILLRVNLYSSINGKPGKNLLKEEVRHLIKKGIGLQHIDLSSHNIVVNEDVIVSIEMLEVYGFDLKFSISGTKGAGEVFVKDVSQGAWRKLKDMTMGFVLEGQYPDDAKELKDRAIPQNITMYWDVSLSMQERDLQKELQFLKKYFSKIKNVKIELICFSDTIKSTKVFDIVDGNMKALETYLSQNTYDGATNFSMLYDKTQHPDLYMVFTEGKDNYGEHTLFYDTPVFYINSKKEGSHSRLRMESFFTNGKYIPLSQTPMDKALQFMTKEGVEDQIILSKEDGYITIEGNVTSANKPIQGCMISVKGTFRQISSDANGNFSIKVKQDEVLVFDFFGMLPQERRIVNKETLKIDLVPEFEVLDEVSIKDKEKTKEKTIYDGVQNKKKESIGYGAQTISKEEFNNAYETLEELIEARFPSLTNKNGIFFIRSKLFSAITSAPPVLFVVDGIQAGRIPDYLNINDIENISLISSLAGTSSLYGSDGSGGVIVISTIHGKSESSEKRVNTALVTGNDYNENLQLINTDKGRPEYLSKLDKSTSQQNAMNTYMELRKLHSLEIPFYLYSSEYFKKWDKKLASQIVSNIAEVANYNHNGLRGLAFKLEEEGDKEKALELYRRILTLKPNYVQSSMDVARLYKENGKYKEAFEMYKQILLKKAEEIRDTSAFSQIYAEIQEVLNLYRSYIDVAEIPQELLAVKTTPLRIVFDWSDAQAQFELQFVNPEKKYFKWKHAYEDNNELLLNEVKLGVFSKEFEIPKASEEWIVNLQSLGENDLKNPSFLKYTVYYNFGAANQTKKVKFIKLYQQDKKVTLDKLKM
ncbi:carboxypeptidase-like regulatory domain-containing protein [Aquimarina sp. 2201CG1-2-11]|uniref:carboxypeptidase-like regulatory domain-containing protein n=1 Tax=Aquimarina discodermiae TaxID=3231043 RepID=UPI003462C88F